MLRGKTESESRNLLSSWQMAIKEGNLYGFAVSRLLYSFTPLPRAHTLELKGIFDNNPALHGQKVLSYPVLDPARVAETGGKIVVFLSGPSQYEVFEQLSAMGLRPGYDYVGVENFWPLYAYYKYGQLTFQKTLNIFVTARCTLRCKHCLSYLPQWADPQDEPLEVLKQDIDDLFNKVDLLMRLGIQGGEPLIYPHLVPYLQYILHKYRNRIGVLFINTNGTVRPDQELLRICQKYPVRLTFSEYISADIEGYETRYESIINLVRRNGIEPHFNFRDTPAEWVAPFPSPEHQRELDSYNEQQLRDYHCFCNYHNFSYEYGHFSACARASVYARLKGTVDRGAVDFTALNISNQNDREQLLMHYLGYSQQGYFDLCRQCPSARRTAPFVNTIPVAEQVKPLKLPPIEPSLEAAELGVRQAAERPAWTWGDAVRRIFL